MSSHQDDKTVPPAYRKSAEQFLHVTPTARAVSSDTNWIASGFEDGTILLIHVPNPRTSSMHQASGHPIRALAFSGQDPPRLACADSRDLLTAWRIHRIQPTGGEPMLEGLAPTRRGPGCSPTDSEHILALAWSADTTQITACYKHGCLFSWYPIAGGQTFDWLASDDSAFPLTFAVISPDSRLLAYGGADGLCHIWNIECRAPQAALNTDPGHTILGAQFDTSRRSRPRIVTWCSAHHARTWDACNGAPLACTRAHSARVRDACLSPNDKLLGCSSFEPLRGASAAPVTSVLFSPGGEFIASAATDGAVCLWEARDVTGPPRVFTTHGGEAALVAFGGDGAVLVSAATDGLVHIGPTPVVEPGRGRVSMVRRLLPSLCIGGISRGQEVRL
ncbi:hypothetical protein TRAPUB_8550 [Trametes pubescens]|uniref:Uncharacterized protein n=1 Tax=Trametes pubescens TaxID=154538 RepID=A0A1M2W573_TRAPU|nr:hypothetical protein TRAPUB_8550 [Trametes pubescens]